MARHQVVICDVCGKPTEKVAGKIYFAPPMDDAPQEGQKKRKSFWNYTHSADVGECCKTKMFGIVQFKPRMTQGEYQQARKDRASRSTVKAKNSVS